MKKQNDTFVLLLRNRNQKKVFRVFVERHYIAVTYVEVTATTASKAEAKARKVVRKLQPDVRATATDNGWQAEPAIEIAHVGFHSPGKGPGYLPYPMQYSSVDTDVLVQLPEEGQS